MNNTDRTPEEVTAAVIRDNYSAIWPPILQPWTDYLIACRTAFDGDLDAMVILAVIGTMTLHGFGTGKHASRLVSYDDMKKDEYAGPPFRRINMESIAAYTGMPKETVRRKVNRLIARGWVARHERGALSATQQSTVELERLSGATFDLLATICSAAGRSRNLNG